MLVNRNSSNELLLKQPEIVEAIQSGKVILFDKVQTSNPDYTTMYFLGMVETESTNDVSIAAASLLGWSDTNVFMMRALQNAKTEIAEKHEIGKTYEGFAIQLVDTNKPAYENHTPRQSKDGETYKDANGLPIYRTGRLVTKEELAQQGHKTIKRVTVQKVQASVSTAAMLAETV